MPTMNPRVNVTLPPALHNLVGRMAELQGVSMSQVLRELLEAAEPALQRAVALMDAASRARGELRQGLGDSLMRAQTRIEDELRHHLALVDDATQDLVTQAERVESRRRRRGGTDRQGRASPSPEAAAGPSDPPSSNRGVKSVPKGDDSGSTTARPTPRRARR
jgi:hypothetical protein